MTAKIMQHNWLINNLFFEDCWEQRLNNGFCKTLRLVRQKSHFALNCDKLWSLKLKNWNNKQKKICRKKKSSPGGMGGWRGVKASLRIAYSNQKVT